MYEIIERYSFTATHKVLRTAACGPHRTVHLHRWDVELLLVASRIPDPDLPSEVADLDPLRRHLIAEFDGKYLNTVLLSAPTPMAMADHLASWCTAHLAGYAAAALRSLTVSMTGNGADGHIASRLLAGGGGDRSRLTSA